MLAAAVWLAAAAPALADETDPPAAVAITASATLASEYRFRGLSRSAGEPVLQGEIAATTSGGFRLGVWSSMARGGNGATALGGSEVDLTASLVRPLGTSGLMVEGGVTGYLFPGRRGFDFWEVHGGLSRTLGPLDARIAVHLAPDPQGTAGVGTYLDAGLRAGIPGSPFTLHGHLGRTAGAFAPGGPFLDHRLGVSATWQAVTLDLSWVGARPHPGVAGAMAPRGVRPAAGSGRDAAVASLTLAF